MMSQTDHSAEAAAPPIELLAPLFPGYAIEGMIAQGGMGVVYQARQLSLDRPVAIKILPRELGGDPVFRASFEAEAKAMARLNHPNLISVYDFGEVEGLLFIIMEYVDGKSLHYSAFGTAIDPVQAGELVSAICRGLEHAHGHGILHRDIKPGNILLDSNAQPKIGDFGLALPIGNEAGEDEAIYGTPGYTAPEVYRKEPASPRSDLYSVGIVLHELLTGSLPGEGGAAPSILCGCPREFDAIVARATKTVAAMRFSSAGELADALDRAVELTKSRPAMAKRPVLAPASMATRAPGLPRPVVAQSRAGVLPWVFGAVAVVVAVVVAMALTHKGGQRDAPNGGRASTTPASPAPVVADPQRDPGGDPFAGGGLAAEENPQIGVSKPSPLDSLAALQGQLAAGSRDAFPTGAEPLRGDHLLLVDQAMTWDEARSFAEAHGAQLAVLPAVADRDWFREKFSPPGPVWLGGGMAARDRWQWIDGSAWVAGGTPTQQSSQERNLALTPAGALAAAPAAQQYHFAIQWRADGEKLATVGAELRRAADSFKAGGVDAAQFPLGTQTFAEQDSHYYVIPKSVPWEDARRLAEAAGGYLAVPSSPAEAEWLHASFAGAKTLLWLGGFRLNADEPWRWMTREAWTHSSWLSAPAAEDPKLNRTVLKVGDDPASSGWIAADGVDGVALGALVEWSRPKAPAAIETFDLDGWLAGVDGKFRARIGPDTRAHESERGKVIEGYVRAMKREARKRKSDRGGIFPGRGIGGFPGRGGEGWGAWGEWRGERAEKTVDEAMAKVEAARDLVVAVPEFAPSEFKDIHREAEQALEKLAVDYQRKLSAHAALYAGGLSKQAAAVMGSGFVEAAAQLEARAASSLQSNREFSILLGLEKAPGEQADAAPAKL